MAETQSSANDEPVPDTFVARRSGEDAVRRAAQVISSRSQSPRSSDSGTRRRSRRARSTPLLAGGGLQFHYAVGILLLFSLLLVAFSERINKKLWAVFHPPTPIAVPGAVAVPSGPAPWWLRAEIPVLLIGFGIWLYLTPGLWDKFKNAVGLNKDDKRLSRKRRQAS